MSSSSTVMFVCLGNICRSPAGEGVLNNLALKKGLAGRIVCESSGTGSWHVGSAPDQRMSKAAGNRGIRLNSKAQVFRPEFYSQFDYILAADTSVKSTLLENAPARFRDRIFLINDFSKKYSGQDVPDPYYGGQDGFEAVLDMLEDACAGLLEQIQQKS